VQPRVSIGVPVYNCDAYLHLALDSLLAQTFSDLEIIISDNASTDSTESVCRMYAARDSRIRYVRQKTNMGAPANFQFVLGQAMGEYFMWAAADDERSHDCVEFYLANIGNSGGVFSTYVVRDRKSATDTVPVLSGQAHSVSDVRTFMRRPCPSFFYGLYRRSVALELYPRTVFDWSDCYYILEVIRSAGFVSVNSAPKYFAGIVGEYVAKPCNGRFLDPFNYLWKALPIAAEAGVPAIFVHLGILATAVKLNYGIVKQAHSNKVLA
jgi:glycosyltransferase involved in cell wall biosynthesis